MKRLAWLVVVGLMCLTTEGLTYDGPTPLLYDQTLDTIRVEFSVQGKAFFAGRTNFTMAAHVPITADNVGQTVVLEVRQYEPVNGDQVIYSCSFVPTAGDIGTTVIYNCDEFGVVPEATPSTPSVEVYPYVIANASNIGSQHEHNGQAQRLTVPFVGDDIYENNDSILIATNLGTVNGTLSKTELVFFADFGDWYKFTAGAGSGSAEVAIQFWNSAVDLDIYIYDAVGTLIAASTSSLDDEERANFAVTPGASYFIEVVPADSAPGFYDMQVIVSAPDIVTITAGPSGTPNPVQALQPVNLTVTASDSLGHPLSYFWTALCPNLPSAGSFSSRYVFNPTWTAPANTTGIQQSCTIKVEVADDHGVTIQGQYVQKVDAPGHALTITAGPTGTPNPVASGGSVSMAVTAIDTFGHSLTYAWQATCLGLGSNGTFTNGTTPTPTWDAPVNLTGVQQNCSIQITVDDGQLTASNSYTQTVNSVPDNVSITAGPSGSPNPVPSQGNVALTVTATDSLDHTLNYAWTATCLSLGSNGTFIDGTTATPTWTAPANATGSQQPCTIGVTVNDGNGNVASGSFVENVSSVPDTVTITDGPTGSPNPVASGADVSMSVTAADSITSHVLTYTWQASCPALGGNGSFANGATATPTWTAPANLTGSQQTCTVTVTAADGHGNTASNTLQQLVNSVADAVTITAGPTGTPNPVGSAGSVSLSVTATDTLGHGLQYSWSAICSGGLGNGTFVAGTTATPTWTSPPNLTGTQQTCTIGVTVDDGDGQTASGSFPQLVDSVSHTVTITAGPGGTPNPVPSGGTVSLNVAAVDSLAHSLAYSWQASCPGLGSGSFQPSASAQNPTWQAPANGTAGQVSCSILVTVDDGQGQSTTGDYAQVVDTTAHTLTITQAPGGTPNPVASGAVAALSVAAVDSLGHNLQYAWSAACAGGLGNGSFANATTATPTWTAPANLTGSAQSCTVQVIVSDGGAGPSQTASYSHTVNTLAHTLTLTQQPGGTPNPVASAGTANLSVAASDSYSHPVHYAWTASCAGGLGGGTFTNGTTASPTWNAPANLTGSAQACTIQVVADDAPHGLTQTASYAHTVGAAPPEPTDENRYYFAEGATINGFFETRFALLNRDPSQTAHVSMDFQLKDTTTVLTHEFDLGPTSRATIDVSTLGTIDPALAILASAEFSTVIRADRPLVADRTMTWTRGQAYGSHAETAILAPAATWYLAEGATIGNFELYYLIQNPNPVPLDFTVTYLLPPPAAPVVRTYPIGANTRTNIAVHAEPGLEDVELSAVITAPAETPIIVERAMYLTTGGLFYGAGHESAGIRQPETQWFFAEGATGDFFDLFILIGNPNTATAHITATFLFDDGTTCSTSAAVDPKSRYNIWVDVTTIAGCPRSLADAAVSTTITSDLPVIAERAMWWPGPSPANWAEAHNAAGAATTGTLWALADGEQGGPRGTETYVLIANTSPYAGTARVTLYFEDGTTAQKDIPLSANSRSNVAIGFEFPTAANRRFGSSIESLPLAGQTAEIVVERAMYSNGPGAPVWAAGTDTLATRVR